MGGRSGGEMQRDGSMGGARNRCRKRAGNSRGTNATTFGQAKIVLFLVSDREVGPQAFKAQGMVPL